MHQKGSAPVIILLIVAGALIAGAIWYFVHQANFSKQVQSNQSAESVTVPSSSISKNYTNQRFGFTFAYPSDWDLLAASSTSSNKSFEISLLPPLKNQPDITILFGDGGSLPVSNGSPVLPGCPFSAHEINCKILQSQNGVSYVREMETGQLNFDRQEQVNGFFESASSSVQFVTLVTDEQGNALPLASATVEVFDGVLSSFRFQ